MPQVRFSSSIQDHPQANTNGTNGHNSHSPIEFVRSAPTSSRAVSCYAEKLAANGYKKLTDDHRWCDQIVKGGKYYIIRNNAVLLAFTVGHKYAISEPSATISTKSQTMHLCLRTAKDSPGKGYERLGIMPISAHKGGKFWWLKHHVELPTKIIYVTNDGITHETVVVLTKKPFLQSLSTDNAQLDVIAKELDIATEDIHDVQFDLFGMQHLSTQNCVSVARTDDRSFSYLALEALLNSSADDIAKSSDINLVACFNRELSLNDEPKSQLNLITTVVERTIDALNPRKDLHAMLRERRPGRIVRYLLLIVHIIYFILSTIRSIISRIFHLFSSFILATNSRELIKSDISTLGKIPSHLAVILSPGKLDRLVAEVADLAAWSLCSSISILTIYESSGELKGIDQSLQIAIKRKLRRYFREGKKIVVRTPGWGTNSSNIQDDDPSLADLEINLLSRDDGREAILDLTRSLCNLASQPNTHSPPSYKEPKSNGIIKNWVSSTPSFELSPKSTNGFQGSPLRQSITSDTVSIARDLLSSDITIPFLDAHLSASTIAEPNLLLVFTDHMKLDGFPPWSIRLCEIVWVGVKGRVTYRGFLRGLKRFGRAEMRWGR